MSKLLKKIAEALPQYKFESVKDLGSGLNGTAYDIGNNIVLKITQDFSEANASNIIKGEKLKYVNEIYDVFEVSIKNEGGVYVIFQKKLEPFSGLEKIALEDFAEDFSDILEDAEGSFTIKQAKELKADLKDYYTADNYPIKEVEKRIEIAGKYIDLYVNSKKELSKYKIKFTDYHFGNIMKDGSDYKIIDLGLSRAPRTNIEQKVVESYLRKKFGL